MKNLHLLQVPSLAPMVVCIKALSEHSIPKVMQAKSIVHSSIEASLLEPLNFDIPTSTLFCIIGDNGTGKSTLLKILAGFIFPQEGAILNSLPFNYLGEKFGLKEKSSIQSFLNIFEQKPFQKIFSYLPKLQKYYLKHRIEILSSGEKMLLNFYRIHQNHKKLWLLDEPFRFLDSANKQRVKNWIIQHVQAEGTVILTDHTMHLFQDEIENKSINIQTLTL